MTFAIHNSGTHAGWKKPMREAKPWTCECNPMPIHNEFQATHQNGHRFVKTNPAYLLRCNDCGTRRP